jgi:hypothetical protein
METIAMDRNKARTAFLDYRRAVRARHDDEDQAIMRGYKALAEGRQLLRLGETIRAGGFDERHSMPRLAICRADAPRVGARLEPGDGGTVTYLYPGTSAWQQRVARGKRIKVDHVIPDHVKTVEYRGMHQAIVPIIPPALRPKVALSNFHILWEADWKLLPPRDPALLRHLGGDLWAVVAIWDLTELERAVLAGRAE